MVSLIIVMKQVVLDLTRVADVDKPNIGRVLNIRLWGLGWVQWTNLERLLTMVPKLLA